MRLFAGLALPDEVKDDLARAARALEPSIPSARWVPRENYHATVSFLGGVEDERVAEVTEALRAAAATVARGEARVDGLGAFPSSRRARVVWAGLADPDAVIAQVAEAVLAALEGIGFPREQRAFHGHVTIARLKVPVSVSLDLARGPAGRVPVAALTLFRSHLGRPAPRYEELAAFPLRGG